MNGLNDGGNVSFLFLDIMKPFHAFYFIVFVILKFVQFLIYDLSLKTMQCVRVGTTIINRGVVNMGTSRDSLGANFISYINSDFFADDAKFII